MSTSIEWTDETWNPVIGCSPVSEGCRNCYAAREAVRLAGNPNVAISLWYRGLAEMRGAGKARRAVFTGKVNVRHDRLDEPLRWRKPRRVFVNSMSDLFHPDVPDEFIVAVFEIMRQCPQHTFQILTKRPERMADFCGRLRFDGVANGGHGNTWLAAERDARGYRLMGGNGCTGMTWVWLGTSCEDQAAADERIPHLLRTPAAVRFLSCEPLIGPIHLHKWLWQGGVVDWELGAREYDPSGSIDWVIVGGESGPGARPCNINWIDDIVDQCRAASVPVFVKQLGARPFDGSALLDNAVIKLRDAKGGDWDEWSEHLRVREFPKVTV